MKNENDDIFNEQEIDEMLHWMHPPNSIMKNLKPCPFCGKENLIWRDSISYGQIWMVVKCDDCGAEGPNTRISVEDFSNDNFEELYKRWDTRQ